MGTYGLIQYSLGDIRMNIGLSLVAGLTFTNVFYLDRFRKTLANRIEDNYIEELVKDHKLKAKAEPETKNEYAPTKYKPTGTTITTTINYVGYNSPEEEDTLNCLFEQDDIPTFDPTEIITFIFYRYVALPSKFELKYMLSWENEEIATVKFKILAFYIGDEKLTFKCNFSLYNLYFDKENDIVQFKKLIKVLNALSDEDLLSPKESVIVDAFAEKCHRLPLFFAKPDFTSSIPQFYEWLKTLTMSNIVYRIINRHLRGQPQDLGVACEFIQASLLKTTIESSSGDDIKVVSSTFSLPNHYNVSKH